MTPTEELINELITLGCPTARALALIHAATMQWAAAPRVRSRHAEAQAKYHAKKKAEQSYLIISDQNDQSDQLQKESPHTPKEKHNFNISTSSLRSEVAAEPPSDRAVLYGKGLKILSKLTGNGDSSNRSLLGRWTKIVDGDYLHVLAAIEDAEKEEPVDPRGWIFARLQVIAGSRKQSAKPLSFSQATELHNRNIINQVFGNRDDPDETTDAIHPVENSFRRVQQASGGVGSSAIRAVSEPESDSFDF